MSEERRGEAPGPGVAEIAREIDRLSQENTRLLDRLGQAERRFRLVAQGILHMQEAERGRLSRELHDSVGQSLTALKMHVELLARSEAKEGGALAAPLQQLAAVADGALQEVREISHLLRPSILDDLGLVPTLSWLARSWGTRTGLKVTLVQEGAVDSLPPDLETLAFRVVQEALTNVAKHAGATEASVHLAHRAGMLRVEVRDGGSGFSRDAVRPGEQGAGFGLRGLRERVQLFGGRLVVDTAPGRGTVVRAEVPVLDQGSE